MSIKTRAQELYNMIHQGQMMEALEEFYHDNVTVIEMPDNQVREGKSAQAESIKEWAEMTDDVHGGETVAITADEENHITMVESWIDVTLKNGPRVKMAEVAVQKWEGDKIIEEKFYFHNPMAGQGA